MRNGFERKQAGRKELEIMDEAEKRKGWRQLKFGKKAFEVDVYSGERAYRSERIRAIARERASSKTDRFERCESKGSEGTSFSSRRYETNGVNVEGSGTVRDLPTRFVGTTRREEGNKEHFVGTSTILRQDADSQGIPSRRRNDRFSPSPTSSNELNLRRSEFFRSLRQLEEARNALEEREAKLVEKERSLEFVEQELLEADLRLQEQAKEQRDSKGRLDALQLQLEEEGKALEAERRAMEEKQKGLVLFEQELLLREKKIVEKETRMAATEENMCKWIDEMSEVASQDTPMRVGKSPLAPSSRKTPMTERKCMPKDNQVVFSQWPLSDRKEKAKKKMERPLDRIRRDISFEF